MSKKVIFQKRLVETWAGLQQIVVDEAIEALTNGGNDWERVSMHRVVTLNTLCSIASICFATQHNRLFSEPPTFFEENNVGLLSNL